MFLRRTHFFPLLIAGVALLNAVVYSASFTYFPLNNEVSPQQPYVFFSSSSAEGVTTSLGPNGTSANVSVACSSTTLALRNPNFFDDLVYWHPVPGKNISIYWSSSSSGAQGGVAIFNGTFNSSGNKPVSDYAYLYQNTTLPNSSINDATLSIRYKFLVDRINIGNVIFEIGINDSLTNTNLWEKRVGVFSRSYKIRSWDVKNYLEPGEKVTVYVRLEVWSKGSAEITLSIDFIYLNISTNKYSFSDTALLINNTDTKPYYARLSLLPAYSSLGNDLSMNISLISSDGTISTPIEVVDGSIISSGTSVTPLNALTTSYVRVSATKTTSINSTLALEMIYTTNSDGSGPEVIYPINLTIDPPNTQTPLVPELINSSNTPANTLSPNLGSTGVGA